MLLYFILLTLPPLPAQKGSSQIPVTIWLCSIHVPEPEALTQEESKLGNIIHTDEIITEKRKAYKQW